MRESKVEVARQFSDLKGAWMFVWFVVLNKPV
jgi:hypothetical protein